VPVYPRQPEFEPLPHGRFEPAVSYVAPVSPPPPPPRQKSLKWQHFVGNTRLRIEALTSATERHAGKINLTGTLVFIAGTYFFIQAQIFAASTPVLDVENILQKAIVHDTEYFDVLGADGTHPRFPSRYQIWDTTNASQWRANYSGNGWLGNTTISTYAQGEYFDDQPFELKLKAQYSSKWGVFREITWVPVTPPATFELDYPSGIQTVIYINGLAAGTVGNPVIQEGTYWVYPGPLKIDFFRNGSKTSDSYEGFIGTTGSYSISDY
jgi:hypothetical protein